LKAAPSLRVPVILRPLMVKIFRGGLMGMTCPLVVMVSDAAMS